VVGFRPSPGRVALPLRRRLPRRAIPYWIATLTLALTTGLVANGLLHRAQEAQARWGSTRTVVVSTRALAPGDPLAGATAVRELPAVALPRGAIPELPAGAVALDPIGAGEVVTTARVGGPAAAAVSGRLPRDTRAVVIPLEAKGLPVRVGDRVDLLASGAGDPAFDGPAAASPSGPVASGALVVEVHPAALVVALDPTDAVAVAAALGRGPLVPALVSAAR
jgi:Flp pilus assembly protein CpaB